MLVPGGGGELSVALVNAVVLALWAALPGLAFGYVRQTLAARGARPQFALRPSETAELDRAIKLYQSVRRRLDDMAPQAGTGNGFWRTLWRRRDKSDAADTDAREDLQAFAEHLRATILRLKRRPLRQLYAWVHLNSSRSALGRALVAHVVVLALAIAAFHVPGQPAWAAELRGGARDALAWYPLDERLFYANAAAAAVAAIVAALFYLLRRVRLAYEYRLEFCVFKDLAESDPGRAIEPAPAEEPAAETVSEPGADERWCDVLGLSPAATIDEVKEAYKALIKQNHPDRVHGMAPAFRILAEMETKKINAAYRQALMDASWLASAA